HRGGIEGGLLAVHRGRLPFRLGSRQFTGRAESFQRAILNESCRPEDRSLPAADRRSLRARAVWDPGESESAPGAAENRLSAEFQTHPVRALYDHADRYKGSV